jgi:Flp pilus assembly secretin CpaC
LAELRTQVIVESGKTIHLGGLIASKVANAAKGLPGGGIMDMFFRGVQKINYLGEKKMALVWV